MHQVTLCALGTISTASASEMAQRILREANKGCASCRKELAALPEDDNDASHQLRRCVSKWERFIEEVEHLLEGSEPCQCIPSELVAALREVRPAATAAAGAGRKRRSRSSAAPTTEKAKKRRRTGDGEEELSESAMEKLAEDGAKAIAKAAAVVREKASSLKYLENLAANQEADEEPQGGRAAKKAKRGIEEGEKKGSKEDTEEQTCPICLDSMGGSPWAITSCGHSGCYECLAAAIGQRRSCPVCKKSLTVDMLYEVSAHTESVNPTAESSATDEQLCHEDYGSKVSALLAEIGQVQARGEKAVVFSAWTRLLRLTEEALTVHGIPTASLIGSPTAKAKALKSFSSEAVVLLVPLFGGASGAGGGGAAGLTLTQASTAVLLEPALQPGIERQAAGRISRIGQTRTTTCIRLIVKESIEPKVLEWQQIRLADGASASPQLTLNDFVQLVGEQR